MVGRKTITFTLKNINLQEVCERYNLNTRIQEKEQDECITDIKDIKANGAFFLDDAKTTHNVKLHTVYIGNKFLNKSNINCYWDRNPIDSDIRPVGCPIEYVYPETVNSYYFKNDELNETVQLNKNNKDGYYIVDGCFCSFNCCLSFIKENIHNPLYKKSTSLLYKMQKQVFSEITEIVPAPDWRLLVEYGGELSIDIFRKDFDNIEHIYKGIFISKSVIRAYEEKYKL